MTKETVKVGHTYVIRNPRVKWDKRVVVHSYLDRPVVQYTNREDGSDHWLYEQMFLERYAHAPDCCSQEEIKEEERMISVNEVIERVSTIQRLAHNPERARSAEDILHLRVLWAIANGEADAQTLASEAIKSLNVPFPRP